MNNPEVAVLDTGYSNDTLIFTKLGDTMRHGIDPPAQLLPDLLYERGIHSIYAPGGTGKTIVALWCAVQVMEQGLNVIYCDEENGSDTIAELLQCYGAEPDLVDAHFHYAEFPHLTSKETERWTRTLHTVRPAATFFDSFADMLALEGYDENSSVQVTQWIKDFAEPVKQLGGAALILDHINKANSGSGARGSSAKFAKVDVAWKLEGTQFDRNTTAELTIKKDKDRMGSLPKKRTFTVGGDGNGNLIFDAGEISNTNDPSELTGNLKAAYEVLVDEYPDGATFTQWEEASTEDEQMSARTFTRVRKELVEGELVSHDKSSGPYIANV
jgi:KaiC/GvpD/RAD55 family RecA-like ATPase